jgi:hypothetical protein
MQRCLSRQKASNTHAYLWKLSENSVDKVPQCRPQVLTYFDILTRHGRQDFMIDLPVLVLFQQTDGLALHDSTSLQAIIGNKVAIYVVPIRRTRP